MEIDLSRLRYRHLRFGWTSLFVVAALGAVLESMHAFKVDAYLAAGEETRRLLWRLAHAHGTLLALVHLVFALGLRLLPAWLPRRRLLASRCLCSATLLIPGGFFLGGCITHAGDPGLGVLLVPIGAVLLFIAVALAARAAGAATGE